MLGQSKRTKKTSIWSTVIIRSRFLIISCHKFNGNLDDWQYFCFLYNRSLIHLPLLFGIDSSIFGIFLWIFRKHLEILRMVHLLLNDRFFCSTEVMVSTKSGRIVLVNIDFVYSVLGEYYWTEPHFFKPYSNCNCIHPVGKFHELSSTLSTNFDKQEMICQNCTILASITDMMWWSQIRNANLPNMRNTIDRYKQ